MSQFFFALRSEHHWWGKPQWPEHAPRGVRHWASRSSPACQRRASYSFCEYDSSSAALLTTELERGTIPPISSRRPCRHRRIPGRAPGPVDRSPVGSTGTSRCRPSLGGQNGRPIGVDRRDVRRVMLDEVTAAASALYAVVRSVVSCVVGELRVEAPRIDSAGSSYRSTSSLRRNLSPGCSPNDLSAGLTGRSQAVRL